VELYSETNYIPAVVIEDLLTTDGLSPWLWIHTPFLDGYWPTALGGSGWGKYTNSVLTLTNSGHYAILLSTNINTDVFTRAQAPYSGGAPLPTNTYVSTFTFTEGDVPGSVFDDVLYSVTVTSHYVTLPGYSTNIYLTPRDVRHLDLWYAAKERGIDPDIIDTPVFPYKEKAVGLVQWPFAAEPFASLLAEQKYQASTFIPSYIPALTNTVFSAIPSAYSIQTLCAELGLPTNYFSVSFSQDAWGVWRDAGRVIEQTWTIETESTNVVYYTNKAAYGETVVISGTNGQVVTTYSTNASILEGFSVADYGIDQLPRVYAALTQKIDTSPAAFGLRRWASGNSTNSLAEAESNLAADWAAQVPTNNLFYIYWAAAQSGFENGITTWNRYSAREGATVVSDFLQAASVTNNSDLISGATGKYFARFQTAPGASGSAAANRNFYDYDDLVPDDLTNVWHYMGSATTNTGAELAYLGFTNTLTGWVSPYSVKAPSAVETNHSYGVVSDNSFWLIDFDYTYTLPTW